MKSTRKDPKFIFICKDEWMELHCSLSARSTLRRLAIVIFAIVTIWGGPELLRFVQIISQ